MIYQARYYIIGSDKCRPYITLAGDKILPIPRPLGERQGEGIDIVRLSCYNFPTDRGWVGVLISPRGLAALVLPQRKLSYLKKKLLALEREFRSQSGSKFKAPENNWVLSFREDLKRYWKGEKVDFSIYPCDWGRATPFQKKVWETVRKIPPGEVSTYRLIAKKIGNPNSYRAVGQALARNPLPLVVPCHRVISSNGNLGGFSAGKRWKKELLLREKGV